MNFLVSEQLAADIRAAWGETVQGDHIAASKAAFDGLIPQTNLRTDTPVRRRMRKLITTRSRESWENFTGVGSFIAKLRAMINPSPADTGQKAQPAPDGQDGEAAHPQEASS
jgi:hypothetical protein